MSFQHPTTPPPHHLRLAVLPDFPAEGWPSMDLCGEMLLAHLPPDLAAEAVSPAYQRLPVVGSTLTRAYNRYIRYPRFVRRAGGRFDLFHVVDHSYSHLVHSLPAGRAGVFCHDLDLFRCLTDPAADPRPWWFRRLARRVLAGLRAAAVVFHGSAAVGDELRRAGLVDPARLVLAPYGVAPEFSPGPTDSPEWLRKLGGRPWVLHVGSCLPRKRVDVLLDVLGAVPDLGLVKVGGAWAENHAALIRRHRLCERIVHLPALTRAELAAAYRHAGAVLVPSGAEGFGLPVVESLACGAPVIASDLPALREAGGPAAVYAAVGDVPGWTAAVQQVLAGHAPPPAARLAWAGRFTWSGHAATIATAYHRLIDG